MDLIVVLTSVFTLAAGLMTYLLARRDVRPAFAAVVVWLVARRFLPSPGVALVVAR